MARRIDIRNGIFVVEDFWTEQECREAISFSEHLGYDEAPVTTIDGPVMMKDLRNNTRVMVDDPARAAALWQRARPFFQEGIGSRDPIGVNERLRFYRYDSGQLFDWHRDGYFERPNGERSYYTFMIYLNKVPRGGETLFLNPSFDDPDGETELKITPRPGLALFFRHPYLHQGAPVLAGRKYVLRTDVMYSASELEDS